MHTSAETLTPAFSQVSFDIENAPKLERKADPPKEKKKAPKVAEASGSASPAPEKEKGKKEKKENPVAIASQEKPKEGEAASAGKAQKKEKKEKKPAEEGSSKKGGNTKAVPEDAGEPVPSMVDLRVGHIVDSEYNLPVKREDI